MSFQNERVYCSLCHGLKNCQYTDRGMRPCYGEVEEDEEIVCSSPTTDYFKHFQDLQVICEQQKTLADAHVETPRGNRLKHGMCLCVYGSCG